MNRSLIGFVVGFSGFVVIGCHSSGPSVGSSDGIQSGVAATVNGESISLPEFSEHTGLKQSAQILTSQGATQTQVIGNFGLQSLQELIDQKVLLQMAKEQDLLPTDAEIDDEIKLQTEIRPDYVDLLVDQGWTTAMVRNELKVGLARQHLIMKGITVSSGEIDDYVKQHPEKFGDPALANIYFIQASTAAKRAEVDKQLAQGKVFSVVASQLSEEPHAKTTGGLFSTKEIAKMPTQIQQIVNRTHAKQASDWIASGRTSFKFFVDSKVPAKPRPVSAAQKELVRRLIAMKKGEIKNNFTKMFYDKLKASKVEVSVPYLQNQWKKTWDQLSDPTTIKQVGAVSGSPTARPR